MPTTELDVYESRNFYGMLRAVQTRSDSNQALSGLQTIEGHVGAVGDRVFLNNQTAPLENGIYVMQTGAWERSGDSEIGDTLSGAIFLITSGNSENEVWRIINTVGSGVVGTDVITAEHLNPKSFYWSVPFTNGSDDFKDDSNDNYQSFAKVIFPGSNNVVVAVAKLIAWVDDSDKEADFRIRDVSNNNNIVVLNNIDNEDPEVHDMGTLNNLSTDEAVWEFQGRNQDGGTYFLSTVAIGTNL